jgi:hypothetical protein
VPDLDSDRAGFLGHGNTRHPALVQVSRLNHEKCRMARLLRVLLFDTNRQHRALYFSLHGQVK